MNLFVSTTTLCEITRDQAIFPARLRQLITQALQQVTTDELTDLLARHEADPNNLDGRIEANLRKLRPSLHIKANCRISRRTGFNSDLVIEGDDGLVCVEIEKGNASRFELDILKMMVCASQQQTRLTSKLVYGAFVVPTDNVVASHVTGNSRESSYDYLCRLFPLVAEVEPNPLADILVVGYGAPAPPRKRGSNVTDERERGSNFTHEPTDAAIKAAFARYRLATVLELRAKLKQACPELREKLNSNSRYLAYAVGSGSDRLYVYIMRRGLVLDLRIPKDKAEQVRAKGFAVRERDNYQGRAGWLTGVRVPHDTGRLAEVVTLAVDALGAHCGSSP